MISFIGVLFSLFLTTILHWVVVVSIPLPLPLFFSIFFCLSEIKSRSGQLKKNVNFSWKRRDLDLFSISNYLNVSSWIYWISTASFFGLHRCECCSWAWKEWAWQVNIKPRRYLLICFSFSFSYQCLFMVLFSIWSKKT